MHPGGRIQHQAAWIEFDDVRFVGFGKRCRRAVGGRFRAEFLQGAGAQRGEESIVFRSDVRAWGIRKVDVLDVPGVLGVCDHAQASTEDKCRPQAPRPCPAGRGAIACSRECGNFNPRTRPDRRPHAVNPVRQDTFLYGHEKHWGGLSLPFSLPKDSGLCNPFYSATATLWTMAYPYFPSRHIFTFLDDFPDLEATFFVTLSRGKRRSLLSDSLTM